MANALFGILIKDMDTRSIYSNLDLITGTSGRTRRNSRDNVLTVGSILHTVIDVDVDVTELMGAEIYLYLGFDGMEDATGGKKGVGK